MSSSTTTVRRAPDRTTIRVVAVGGSARLVGSLFLGALLLATGCRETAAPRTLEVLVPFLPSSLDPFADTRLLSRGIVTAVFEPLAEVSAEGIRPALASSWLNPAPDTWVFQLAPDATFHDGSPVTSHDVLAAVQAARQARSSLVGLAELTSSEAVGHGAVRFRTDGAAQDFLFALSALLVAKPAVPSVGSGPFQVVSFDRDLLVLRRYERYRGRRPFLDEVRLRRVASPADGLRRLRASPAPAVLEPTRAMLVAARADPRLDVATFDSGGLAYLATGFSAGAGPMADVRVRRALRLALDLTELARVCGAAGGTPAGQLIPPGSFGHDPRRKPPARDLDEARRLLAEAGYPGGFEMGLDVNLNGRETAEALVRQAAEIGIVLRLNVLPADEFVARIEGRSPLFVYSWFTGQDAGQAIRNFFHTRDAGRGLGIRNRTGYSSAAVDRALAELAALSGAPLRLAKIRQISDLLEADLPWIPLFCEREARILPAWLELPWRPDGLLEIGKARGSERQGAPRS